MSLNKLFKTFAIFLIALFIYTPVSYSGLNIPESDSVGDDPIQLFYFFDLRERETFVQLTNADTNDSTVHVQIWDVSNNCNENNFFDTYTPADTHVYNMRDIQTNNGSPAGAVLPDGAYGIVSIVEIDPDINRNLVGNFRILDNNGYEYRTNAVNARSGETSWDINSPNITFNYNTKGNITLSDVVGIAVRRSDNANEVALADITDTYYTFDIDIYNLSEVPFSCRNVIFACTNQDNPLYEALLEESGDASVAGFEYGINDAIPHTKGGELLCPNNIVSEGFVTLNVIDSSADNFLGYVGLNNGNGRGSMDSLWYNLASEILGIL